jgi:hypothetical protein
LFRINPRKLHLVTKRVRKNFTSEGHHLTYSNYENIPFLLNWLPWQHGVLATNDAYASMEDWYSSTFIPIIVHIHQISKHCGHFKNLICVVRQYFLYICIITKRQLQLLLQQQTTCNHARFKHLRYQGFTYNTQFYLHTILNFNQLCLVSSVQHWIKSVLNSDVTRS